MCGIVGIASTKPQAQRAWLNLGRDAMAHRGPDDAGSGGRSMVVWAWPSGDFQL